MKRILAVLVVMVLSLAMIGSALAAEKVGVSMPTQSLQRWNQDGANVQKALEAAGYEVELQFADSNSGLQVSQLETMILNGCKVLIIAAEDGSSLGTVLATAKENDVKVIAYDRLIMQTEAVDYYATFDLKDVGRIQGRYIEETLGLKDGAGPFNMEAVAGDPADNNAPLFYEGAIEILQPYLDSKQIVIPSGQFEFDVVATPQWNTATAQARVENILMANYSDGTKLDIVLCSNDSTAMGAINALTSVGVEEWPIITGQDCDVANMPLIVEGKQSMSVFKDTRELAAKAAEMADALVKGGTPEINNSYNNGVKDVETFTCTPVFGSKDNYQALLIDSGYLVANADGTFTVAD